jgi:hypothetical protein
MGKLENEYISLKGLAPQVDLGGIGFPSDNLTLAALRKQHLGEFDTLKANFFDGERMRESGKKGGREALAEMIYIERRIAQETFQASVRGDRQAGFLKSTGGDDRGLVEDLTSHYLRYGLAQGPHEALRLIGLIESQATTQADHFKRVVSGQSR